MVCSRNLLNLTGYQLWREKSCWSLPPITAVIKSHEGFYTFALSPWASIIFYLCRRAWRQSHLLFTGDLMTFYKILEQEQTRHVPALSSPNCQIQSGFHEGIQHKYLNLYPVYNLATTMWEYI